MTRTTLFLLVSGFLFVLASAALLFLLLSDLWFHFEPTARHGRAVGFVLIFAGLSFICFLLGSGQRRRETIKGMLLGLAFALWGGEQFLRAGVLVTVIDTLVITIFVVDLGLAITAGLGRRDQPGVRSPFKDSSGSGTAGIV